MRANKTKMILQWACGAFLLLAGSAQAAVVLTAQSTTTTLPDGQTVPMWGLFCGSSTTVDPNGAPCTTETGTAQDGASWQPPLITVQSGAQLDIELHNNLPGPVPTSLVIVGQLGGGLGTAQTRTPAARHHLARHPGDHQPR